MLNPPFSRTHPSVFPTTSPKQLRACPELRGFGAFQGLSSCPVTGPLFPRCFWGAVGELKCEKNMFGNKHANPESLLEHCTWFSSFQFGSVYLRTMPSMCAIPTTQTVLQRGSNIRRVGQWILQFPIVAPCRLFWKSFHELLEQLEGPKVWTSNNQRQNNQPVLSEVNVLERKSCVMQKRLGKASMSLQWSGWMIGKELMHTFH